MVMMDPPEHTAFRRLVGRGFTPRHVEEIEPAVRAFAVERIERLRAAGEGDIVTELFKPMPSFVVAYYLGVPEEDWSRFDAWTEGIVAANAQGDPLPRRPDGGGAVRLLQRADRAEARATRGTTPSPRWSPPAPRTCRSCRCWGSRSRWSPAATTPPRASSARRLSSSPGIPSSGLGSSPTPDLLPNAVEELLRLAAPVQCLARTTTRRRGAARRGDPGGQEGAAPLRGRQPRPARVRSRPRTSWTSAEPSTTTSPSATAPTTASVRRPPGCRRAWPSRSCSLGAPTSPSTTRAGTFAPGHFVRRYETLPFTADIGA